MKGIILAGGRGTRLYPLTLSTCKQLLPVFDKPLIYYPLAILMQAGIRDILIITTPEDLARFQALFKDGSHLGISICYDVQPEPKGIAEAFVIGADFIGKDSVCLILGDNLFHGHNIADVVRPCTELKEGGIVFGYEVSDPQRYGVIAFDDDGRIKDIIEKPKDPPSSYAVTGLYFYDNAVIDIARNLKLSKRGEYEITDVNVAYLQKRQLNVRLLDRGFAWLDTGTHDALQKASSYVQTIQERQGIKIACLEEIAYQQGFISFEQLERLAQVASISEYGLYLQKLCLKTVFAP
ncbi:MAG TPA: glucose-1-phosphate thymidylyltransferase RfbA [Rhabdochlamydiaceae bacterium]|jgi:glucose-1-phosphate thymidylyltransferase|nr:glucose-1-phosphate thymidylyltransferase RfbA [Rhabdochlamydiaceae bacterium]